MGRAVSEMNGVAGNGSAVAPEARVSRIEADEESAEAALLRGH